MARAKIWIVMRIIIPHAYNVKGGVERVTIFLIREFEKIFDKVIFILPNTNMAYFQKILPPSNKLIYETFSWPKNMRSWKRLLFKNIHHNLLRLEKRKNPSSDSCAAATPSCSTVSTDSGSFVHRSSFYRPLH